MLNFGLNEIEEPILKPTMGCNIPCRRRRIRSSPYPPSLSHDFRLADVNLWPASAAAVLLLLLPNPQLHYRSPLQRLAIGSKLPTVQRAAAGTGSKTHVNREGEGGDKQKSIAGGRSIPLTCPWQWGEKRSIRAPRYGRIWVVKGANKSCF